MYLRISLSILLLAACASTPPPSPARSTPALAPASSAATTDTAEPRSEADQKLDAGRKPQEMLAFFGIAKGMRVAEIVAGGGYTTELLARAVGPKGEVYGQNPRFVLEKFADKPWTERLGKPVMANVHRVDRELESPLPPEAHDLDAVLDVLFYHDTVWLKTDRDAMNRAIFAALKPGGVYGIVDHSARAGRGLTEVQSLHRIEESLVVEEIQRAGFQLAARSDTWRNAQDARDWNASPSAAADRRGSSDRFALKFVKPSAPSSPGSTR